MRIAKRRSRISTILLGLLAFSVFQCELPPYGVLTLFNPDNQTRWEVGLDSTAQVNWFAQNLEGPINISLLHDHEPVMLITDTVDARSKKFTWTVPGFIQPGQGYSIYLKSPTDSMAWVESKIFRIDPYVTDASLDIIHPRQNDNWEAGVELGAEIIWDATGLTGLIRIELLNGPDVELLVADSIPAMLETFKWTVPTSLTPGDEYSIRLSTDEDEYLFAFSKPFHIRAKDVEYELDIIRPISRTRWVQQQINGAVIEWSVEDLDGTFCIDLMQDDTLVHTIKDSVNISDLKYSWTVPQDVPPANNYVIRLRWNELETISILSRRFKIEGEADTPTLEITAPTRGDKWYIGEANAAGISWAYSNISGNVKIDLYDRNSFYGNIAEAVSVDSGGLIWTVPDTIPQGKGYKVYLEYLDNPEVNSTSDPFDIVSITEDQEIEIVEPRQNDEWIIGIADAANIEWNSLHLDSTVRIDLYDNNTFLFNIVNGVDVVEGYYAWTVPDSVPAGKGYKVYVESNRNPDANDMSGRITLVTPEADLELLRPDKGDEWIIAEVDAAFISWSSVWLDSTINIHLYNQSEFFMSIAEDIDIALGSFNWTVPTSVPAGKGYKVYVESNRNPDVNDMSDRIDIGTNETELELLRPDKGEEWVVAETDAALISWSSVRLDSTINIHLYDQSGYYMSIAEDIDIALGSFRWTVPNTVPAGKGYTVHVESTRDPDANDMSGRITLVTPEAELELLRPDKSDEWIVTEADAALISWSSVRLDSTINIHLHDQSGFYLSIADDVEVDLESITWTVPEWVIPGNGYKVYIESNRDLSLNDLSSRLEISTPTPVLSLRSPEQGDKWIIGQEGGAQIFWESSWIDGDVRIDLYNKNELIAMISNSTDITTGAYTWTVPDSIPAGRGYQIQLTALELPDIVDVSSQFQISEPERSLTILKPDKNDEWFIGDSLGARISWSSMNIDGSLKIDLYNQNKFQLTIVEDWDIEEGEYLWTVPNSIEAGKSYKISLHSLSYPDIEQQSGNISISDL
ncbi:MAG: GPI anchored serine-threonine rich family protein [Candidatus Marinimicrobia bacterium]|nr:GPI anchored serine-threonine rich family protein [Candidatus Neomarinimicrobiota bacterium]MCF7851577.1 GPI anchored serine-threonine rich family protein [Candidatus Neomarinimicrobiota bacterium]